MTTFTTQGALRNEAGEALFAYANQIFWAPFTIVGDGGNGGKVGS